MVICNKSENRSRIAHLLSSVKCVLLMIQGPCKTPYSNVIQAYEDVFVKTKYVVEYVKPSHRNTKWDSAYLILISCYRNLGI